MNNIDQIKVLIATDEHLKYVDTINDTIQRASEERGTGIARRTHEYIANKMKEGKAIIALDGEKFAGFCYIESWGHQKYVANSGLIVEKAYRGGGLAKRIKRMAFELSRKKFPDAKLFGLTTGLPVMKINYFLGIDRRSRLLERMSKLCQLRHPDADPTYQMPVYGNVVRSGMGEKERGKRRAERNKKREIGFDPKLVDPHTIGGNNAFDVETEFFQKTII
jgi:GNAT superfamily N-acetyltransferase